MFCPECGIEERQSNQFCRACGADLRLVRGAIEMPDSVTASAASAREEIGRAIASKIRDTQSAEELSVVAEDVLPQIEKFLESPEEKRLRRMRLGMLLASIGLGAAIGITIVSRFMNDRDVIFLAAIGVVTFFLGLGFVLNGVLLTVPGKHLRGNSSDADAQRQLDGLRSDTNELNLPSQPESAFRSVTEHTTRHLKEKESVER